MQENNTIEQIAVESPDIAEKTQVEQPLQQDAKSDNEVNAISYGKFKSAESLFEGYQQLEKEFTKKCQVLKELESRAGDSKQILEKMLQVNPELEKYADTLNNAKGAEELGVMLAQMLVGKINEPCNIINDEDFLNKYIYSNENIINKIIVDYMDSLVNLKIPQTILRCGNSYVSPTYRPRNLDEAGKMAKKFIETRRF